MMMDLRRVMERLELRRVCLDALSFEPHTGETLRRPPEEVLADWFADELERQGAAILELYAKSKFGDGIDEEGRETGRMRDEG